MDSSMSDGERSSELDRSSDHLEAAAEDSEGGPERKKMKLDPDQSKGSESDDPLAKLLESPGSDKTSESKPAPPKLPKLNISSASGSSGGEAEEERTPGLLDTPTTPHPDGLAAMERLKAEQAQEDREKMQLLVSRFTEDQLDRYAMYRRSALPKTTVKKIMQTITGSSVGQNVVIAMAGIAKVFAGEVIEEALASMESVGEAGQPVRPKHLREAVRKMRSKGTFMPKLKKKCPFN